MQTLSLENGKYELRFDEASGALTAWRYGEPWQDFTGNKFIYLLMQAATQAQPAVLTPINYFRVHKIAEWRKIDYNSLCDALRDYLGDPS